MNSRQRGSGGIHTVKRTLADGGTKEYHYVRRRGKIQPRAADALASVIIQWQESPVWRKLAPATQIHYSHYLKPMWRIGHIPIGALRRADLLTLRDKIAAARGDGAAHGFTRAVSKLFSFALDRGIIEYNPATRLATDLERGHLKAWTQEEADTAIAKLPEHLRRVVVLALYTGQRRGDLCALTWSAYDGEAIRLTQQKTGEPLVVPCHPALKAELDEWSNDRTATTMLTDAHGKPWKPNLLSHYLPDALVRIGLSNEINVHGLRKLAAANLAEAGCSVKEIAAITGHRTLGMVELYTRSADQQRLATAAIVRFTNRSGETKKR